MPFILPFIGGMVTTILLEVLAIDALLAPIRAFIQTVFGR
jgi:hypothetical protein